MNALSIPVSNNKILVTGVSGDVGKKVSLLLHSAGISHYGFARDPQAVSETGCQHIFAGDYADGAALDIALQGINTLFLVSISGKPFDRARQQCNVIDSAVRNKVDRIIYLSFMSASATSSFPYSADHLLTEAHLRQSGVSYVILRDSFYMDLIPDMANTSGQVKGPGGDGKVGWVSRLDVCRAACRVIADPLIINRTFNLTGPELLSLEEAISQLQFLGLQISWCEETMAEARAWRLATGASEWEVDVWLGSYEAMGSGELSSLSNDILKLTGREPISLREYFSNLRPSLNG